jgi:Domain of unknown function (DUF4214)
MYESEVGTITTALQTANPTVFSQATIDSIVALTTRTGDTRVVIADNSVVGAGGNVAVTPGAEVVLVAASNLQQIVNGPVAPVVVFQGRGGVTTTFNDGVTVPASNGVVDRVVVGSAGNDIITIADARDTKVILGTGNSSVRAGSGVDTIEAGLGNSTVTGGTGDFAVVKLAGNAEDFTVVTTGGKAVVTNMASGKTTEISKIQFVQLDDGNALVFAKDSAEATVANLYRVAFGRDADAGGLDFFFDAAKAGASLKVIANAFASSAEFATAHAAQDNTAFVQSLYQNTFNRMGEDDGVAFFVNALTNGASRADIITNFAQVATQNIMDGGTTEATLVGSVMIVTGII